MRHCILLTFCLFIVFCFSTRIYLSNAQGTVSTSSSVTITATVLSSTPPPTGGGGGGSSEISNGSTIVFSGRAYPRSFVTILKDGKVIATTTASQDSTFSVTVFNIAAGKYSFSVYTSDKNKIKSATLSMPMNVSPNTLVSASGIFIAPSIGTNKVEVKKGDIITFFGQTVPRTEVTITVNSEKEHLAKVQADQSGVYLLDFDTTPLEMGKHTVQSKTKADNMVSPISDIASFMVGNNNVPAGNTICPSMGDLNNDCRVNLADFSIAAYWYNRVLDQSIMSAEQEHLNNDDTINLIDFSILAYHWTG